MPPRKRHRRTGHEPATPASSDKIGGVDADALRRFNAGLRRTEQRQRDERDRQRNERAHAEALVVAQQRLERAIAAVRAARQSGRGAEAADAEWRAAKGEVLFLETGERPAWAPDALPDAADDAADVAGDADTGEAGDPDAADGADASSDTAADA